MFDCSYFIHLFCCISCPNSIRFANHANNANLLFAVGKMYPLFNSIIPENGEMKMPVAVSFCLSLRLKTVRERLILIGKKTCGKEGKG